MLVGSFLGDYVKGRLTGQHGEAIERGIRLHRAIDAFTDQSELVKTSHRRFDKAYYRFGGIMTDVIFDHFLARQWHDYYDDQLDEFSKRTLQTLVDNADRLTESALRTAERMLEFNAMAGYGSEAYVERSFNYLSTRLSRENPLSTAFSQYLEHETELNADFQVFYPELIAFCNDWKKTN